MLRWALSLSPCTSTRHPRPVASGARFPYHTPYHTIPQHGALGSVPALEEPVGRRAEHGVNVQSALACIGSAWEPCLGDLVTAACCRYSKLACRTAGLGGKKKATLPLLAKGTKERGKSKKGEPRSGLAGLSGSWDRRPSAAPNPGLGHGAAARHAQTSGPVSLVVQHPLGSRYRPTGPGIRGGSGRGEPQDGACCSQATGEGCSWPGNGDGAGCQSRCHAG